MINDLGSATISKKEFEEAWEQVMTHDHYAMYAMQGLLAANCEKSMIPKLAFEIADAMMEMRRKRNDHK